MGMVYERDADSQVHLIYLLWPVLTPSPPNATMHALTRKISLQGARQYILMAAAWTWTHLD
jgi:hypothetical protein